MGLVVAVCGIALLAGFLFKAQCATSAGWDGRQYSRLCYNDIQSLYDVREIDEKQFPYVAGELHDQELTKGAIEYPVLTGVFMWLAGLAVDDPNAYLWVTAALLAPFGLVVALLLARMTGWAALLWAGAPAVVLYSFHNWDLLAVAAAVGGIWLWWRDRDLGAAVVFGIGGATKLFPIFLMAPLVLYVVRERGWRHASRVAATGIATLVAVNLPFALANFDGWIATYRFHSLRTGNLDSIWNLGFPSVEPSTLNLVTAALTAAAFAVALGVGWMRAAREGVFPFVAVAGALVAAFLLFSKVHSPQYTLWLLPFFPLTSVSVGWWIAYTIVDLAVYIGVFRWFYDFLYLGQDFTFFKKLMIAGVWGRAALCLALFAVFLRSRDAVSTQDAELSQSVSKVLPAGDPEMAT